MMNLLTKYRPLTHLTVNQNRKLWAEKTKQNNELKDAKMLCRTEKILCHYEQHLSHYA